MKILTLITLFVTVQSAFAQQGYYDVVAGNGNGVRFWASDANKIHMGLGAEYQYGPVTDYSIKMNAPSNGGRGWVWGIQGATPIAALDNTGKMQIAGLFNAKAIRIPGRHNFGIHESAFEIEVPSSQYNAIRAMRGTTIHSTIHFFDASWQGGSPNSSAGSINLEAPAVTLGYWTGPGFYFRRSDGFVGIGTTSPDAKLAVKGKVHAQEVKVDLTGAVAPDYVFDKDYKLPSLAEIKSYIDKHHHLPEVPSAKQMEEEGMNVGEMNLTLLKKIEELTLYIIEQEARMLQQDERIKALEAKNK